MPMDRYFCNLCNRIVKYGEVDPCFFYKDVDKIYTVPPPNESEATERKDGQTEEIHRAYLNDQNSNACPAAEQNDTARSNETASLLLGNKKKISLLPSSRRKRSRLSSELSTFLSGEKNRHFDPKMVSSATTERDGNTADARQSKRYRKMESESAEAPDCSTSGMTPSSVALGPVSVAGPSGNQEQTDRKNPLVCDVCGKVLSSKRSLERHEITHTGAKPFECGVCGKGFSQQGTLSRHLLTYTGERRFSCKVCGKGFSRKEGLQIHFRTHSGEQPFECQWRGRKFSAQSSCKRHKKNCTEKNVVDS